MRSTRNLKEEEIDQICIMWHRNTSPDVIATEFRTSPGVISNLANSKGWEIQKEVKPEVAIEKTIRLKERWDALLKRQTTVISEIEKQGKLTDELKNSLIKKEDDEKRDKDDEKDVILNNIKKQKKNLKDLFIGVSLSYSLAR
jgi:hypothetical protein